MRRTHLNDEAIRQHELSSKRHPLLEAWEILRGNILFGAEEVTEERKAELIEWYRAALAYDEEALNDPPEEILRYRE